MWILLLLLFARVMCLIVYEYHRYFPPDFTDGFLVDREPFFWGLYSAAFYLHITVGPFVLLIAVFLMLSGQDVKFLKRFAHWHRPLGKIQFALIVFLLMPSGIVMSTQANTGNVAGLAFFLLSVGVGFTIIAAAWFARQRDFMTHRLWAMRCFLMLCSPILLRLMQGAAISLNLDSQVTYPFSAWISWTLPLAVFEVQRIWQHRFGTFNLRSRTWARNAPEVI